MGISASVQQSDAYQSVTNRILQESNNYCTSSVVNKIEGNTVIIGTNKSADINIGNISGVKSNTGCTISSTMNTEITNLLEAALNQSLTPEVNPFWVPIGVSVNGQSSNSQQIIANNVSQLNQSFCTSSIMNDITSNYVYIAPSSGYGEAGNISVFNINDASSNSMCTLNNYMKVSALNQQMSTITQKQLVSFIMIIVILVILIAAIIGIKVLVTNNPKTINTEDINKISSISTDSSLGTSLPNEVISS